MPQAVTHILVPLIIAALFKDYYDKGHKKKLSLHYVLIAGIAGIIPDLDVLLYWVIYPLGFQYESVHRSFTHTLFVPLIFLALFFVFKNTHAKARICNLGKHNLKLSWIFLAISFGALTHLILDAIVAGTIMPLHPISNFEIGLSLIDRLPQQLKGIFIPSIEAGLLVIWLIYLELKHKISDYV